MNNFSIIVPTLNEAENIVPLLQRISAMAETSGLKPEVIFVDDNSTDATCQQVLAYKGSLEVRLHERIGAKGLAGAVVTGGRLAKYDNLVIMDADLSHPPEVMPQLILPLLSGKKDMVIGSRYTEGGSTPDWPFLRRLSSRIATFPAHLLTGIEDPLAGFFSIKKNLLEKIDPDICGFKIGFELLRKYGNEIRTAEVPVRFTDRFRGQSKMRLPILIHYSFQLLEGIGINLQVAKRPLVLLIGLIAAIVDTGLFSLLSGQDIGLVSCHMASFLVALHLCFCIGLPILLKPSRPTSLKVILKSYLYCLLISALGLFVRGGILSILFYQEATQITTLAILGLFTFFTWLLFASTLHTDADAKNTNSRPAFRMLAAAIIIYSLVLRLLYFGTTELLQEEAYYWNYARHMAPGYLDHPPLVATLIWLGTKLLGHVELGIRLGAFCCWFATAYFSYALTKAMFNAKAAINAILLIAILPIFFASALIMTPDAPLITCWAATLYFLYRALIQDYKLSWIFAGLFFGLGFLSKYTIVFLAPATLLFMLIDPSSRRWLMSPMPYLAAIVALVIFSPVIWWNFENNWASFLFQSHGRLIDERMFSTHILLGSLLLLLTPVGLIAALSSLVPSNMSPGTNNIKETTPESVRRYRFCLVITLTPLLVFFFFSFTKEVKLNWTGPLWLATIPFVAQSIQLYTVKTKAEIKTRLGRVVLPSWQITFISLILIYGAALHYIGVGIPGVSYPTNTILLGWDNMAKQIEDTVKYHEEVKGKRPIVVGMDRYRITSGLSFYHTKLTNNSATDITNGLPPVTGRHLFGLRSLMYRYWHPPQLFAKQDILALSQSKIGLHKDYFINKVRKIGRIKEMSIKKRGEVVGKFYYRFLQGYNPPISSNEALQQK